MRLNSLSVMASLTASENLFMQHRFAQLIALVMVMAGNGHAMCVSGSMPIFSCTTQREKQIEICESAVGVEYSYGPIGARPEIVVRASRTQVGRRQWMGAQRWVFRALDIPNGKTVYNVYWGADGQNPEDVQEGGVNVIDNDTVIATVTCQPGSIIQDLDSVFVPRAARQVSP
jgi:hypothetical protein